MVSINDFLLGTRYEVDSPMHLDLEDMPDLDVPSPPKALYLINRKKQQLQEEEDEMQRQHSGLTIPGLRRSPSIISRVASIGRSPRLSADGSEEGTLQQSPSVMSHVSTLRSPSMSTLRSPSMSFRGLPRLRETSTEALLQRSAGSHPSYRSGSTPSDSSLQTITPTRYAQAGKLNNKPSFMSITKRRRSKDPPAVAKPTIRSRTHFMNPSELESLMQPLREDYIRSQTNELTQAKAAYDQLNEQLTSELPQLIDLR